MEQQNRNDALFRLLAAEGIGPGIANRLMTRFGSPEAAVEADPSSIARVCGLNEEAARLVARAIDQSDPAWEEERLQAIGARYVLWSQPEYPEQLCRIPDPPPVLRIQGQDLAGSGRSVAIVGTRSCTAYGLRQASRFASALASAGVTVVSGGARGIDAEAHRATLRSGGRTIVVLGSGLGHPYPLEHRPLFREVIEAGGTVLSEFSVDRPPRPGQFPRRNRIVAGLSIGVLVVEAPRRSGAMITARLAVESQGREAWAVPGSVDQRTAEGCHAAIGDGWAALVHSPEDLLQRLDDAGWFRADARVETAPR